MTTLRMIKDWQESNFKKTYIQTNSGFTLPTTIGGRDRVLRVNGFKITIHDPIPYTSNYVITNETLLNEWEEITKEYNIKEAISKAESGDKMVSLASSNRIDKANIENFKFSTDEIKGTWIEVFK